MKLLSKTILLCLLAGPVLSQTKKEPTLQDLQRQMLEMQRQIFQQFQQLSPGNPSFDTTFSFHIDSLFGDQSMGRRFDFSPFGQDTTFMRYFGDQPPTSDGFKPFGEGFQWSYPPEPSLQNEENSALNDPGDGLLPEERLRKEEETGTKPSEKQTKPEPKKPKIKTIRI